MIIESPKGIVSPAHLNPWDSILGWIGKKTNGDMREQIRELKNHVQDMWVASHRQTVLTFAREAREGVEHSSDEMPAIWGRQ